MKLLIVDDETKIQLVLKEYASFEGYEADLASNGLDAIKMAKENDYDLIIMDVMMPGLDGFSAVKEIKKYKDIPVLMLSARSEEYDKLHGFEIGVDDYVTKPFSPKEVMLRINAITRRNKKKSEIRKFNGLEVDMPGRNVFVDGKKIDLTPKECDLLFYLIINEGIVLTREQLLSNVWGYDYFGDDRTVDTHIKMLRNNLGPYRDYIVTSRGSGYKFEQEKK
jgi:DNA-binding response OmpR family regulator